MPEDWIRDERINISLSTADITHNESGINQNSFMNLDNSH